MLPPKTIRLTKSLAQLQEFLAEFTSSDPEDVKPTSHLEDDLGLTLADDLAKLISQINHEFQINLKTSEVMDELEAAGETVAELAKLIDDECELG